MARLAGVSQATVSLVLNGAGGDRSRVGRETERRVLDAIEMTGYSANPMAQSLARGRNGIVGVFTYEPVFPRTGGDFYHPFLIGIEDQAEQLGCDVLLFTSPRVQGGRRRFLGQGWHRLAIADGCLLLGRHDDKAELASLVAREFPFVFIGRRDSEAGTVPYVGADYVTGTRRVVELLVEHGHRRIGFLGDLGPDESSRDRVRGYRESTTAAGLRPILLEDSAHDADEAVDLIVDNRLTAAVLGADYRAEEVASAAQRRGLNVPADLSLAILGEPERPLSAAREWSGFRIPREDMGATAMRLLFELIEGRSREELDLQRLLDCPLVAGETIAPPSRRAGKR